MVSVSTLCKVWVDLVGGSRASCMWESHGIAVRPVTLVVMMDGMWEVRFSQRCRESLWAV